MKKERKNNQFIKKPYYQGGNSAIKAFISQHLTYPETAIAEKIEGTVHVRYTINYKGKVIATKIISGIGHDCNEEAVRLVKMLEFIAPHNRNIKALFHKTIQIHFRLPKIQKKEIPQPSTQTIQYHFIPTKKEQKTIPEKGKKGGSFDIIIPFG